MHGEETGYQRLVPKPPLPRELSGHTLVRPEFDIMKAIHRPVSI